eukprot:1155645-Pelagomonas_calceolata.AAC.2
MNRAAGQKKAGRACSPPRLDRALVTYSPRKAGRCLTASCSNSRFNPMHNTLLSPSLGPDHEGWTHLEVGRERGCLETPRLACLVPAHLQAPCVHEGAALEYVINAPRCAHQHMAPLLPEPEDILSRVPVDSETMNAQQDDESTTRTRGKSFIWYPSMFHWQFAKAGFDKSVKSCVYLRHAPQQQRLKGSPLPIQD